MLRIAVNKRSAVAVKEGINGIDGINRSVPCLRTLGLEQPSLHLANGLDIVGLQSLQSLNGSHLRRNAIVEP